MRSRAGTIAESDSPGRFAGEQPAREASRGAKRLNLDPEQVGNGIARLVLTLVKLLQELLERQAIRRMDAQALSEEQIERLGLALMKQSEQIEMLREAFGLSAEDLNLDLGPLGTLR